MELARRLREMPLRKGPSISEVIDAARAAAVLDKGTGEEVRTFLLAALDPWEELHERRVLRARSGGASGATTGGRAASDRYRRGRR